MKEEKLEHHDRTNLIQQGVVMAVQLVLVIILALLFIKKVLPIVYELFLTISYS